MKRWISLLLAAAITFSLAGCGKSAQQGPEETDPPVSEEVLSARAETSLTPPDIQSEPTGGQAGQEPPAEAGEGEETPIPPSEETAAPPAGQGQESAPSVQTDSGGQRESSPPEPASEPESPRILIAYFTWADNTVVEDQEAAVQGALDHYESIGDSARYEGVDATSSASVVAPGNAAKIAAWIQQEVGGDLFSIVAADLYPSDYDECLDRAADEKAENARPALSTHVSGMEDYDIVFLGFPNWWYTLPMPVLSFVDEYDFSGKIVVPFCTHGTGGLSATVRDLTAALPDDVTVLDPIGVYRPDVDSSRPAVQTWIAGLDLNF